MKISEDQVPFIFDDVCVGSLTRIARLPDKADAQQFGADVRAAAVVYIRRLRAPHNQLRRERETLHRLAARDDRQSVIAALSTLSDATCEFLTRRAGLAGMRHVLESEQLCATIVMLTRIGLMQIKGRTRPSGRRSVSLKARVAAPAMVRHPPIRAAERAFALWLRLAYWKAAGRMPARTAHHEKHGPFVRLLKRCLELTGAHHVDAVEIIESLKPRRPNETKQPVTSQPLNDDDEDRG
jgi:hypothetical protein